MFKKIFKTHSIIKTLCALVLGSSLSISALADGATETVGYSTFQAVVTHGSNDTIGSPTSFRAGDTIQWAGVYSAPVIDYPQWKEHTILFPSGQPYEAGKTYAMYGYTTVYKVNGGWTTAEPAQGALIEGVKFTYKPKESVLTSPPKPSVQFTGGGDGFEVISYQGKLYIVNHHQSGKPLKCFDAVTAQTCVGWEGGKSLDTPARFYKTVLEPMSVLNRETGELWFVTTYYTQDNFLHNGFACFNLNLLADCGFIEVEKNQACHKFNTTGACANTDAHLYPTGKAWVDGPGFQRYNALSAVGSKLFSISHLGNLGCVDAQTKAPCVLSKPGPYKIPQAMLNKMNSFTGTNKYLYHVSSTVMEDKILVTLNKEMYCINTVSGDACSGAWPVTGIEQRSSMYGPRLVLNADGKPIAACVGYGGGNNSNMQTRKCFTETGAPYTLTSTQALMSNAKPFSVTKWDATVREFNYKSRVFSFDEKDYVQCFDFALGANCPNFPKTVTGGKENYTITNDPERLDCLWTNSNSGFSYSFDAMGADKCSGSPNPPMTLISKPITAYKCHASSIASPPKPKWRAIALSANAGIKVTAKVYNLNTTALIATKTIEAGERTVSIADINYDTHPEIKVELTLGGQTSNETAIAADIVWEGPEHEFCVSTKPTSSTCLVTADWFGSSGLVGNATSNYSKAINGKGLSLSVLLDGFNIASAVSSIRNEDKPLVFHARFDEKTLSGEMLVSRLNTSTGLPGPTLARASEAMIDAGARVLLTQRPDGKSVDMSWNNLSDDLKAKLNKKLSGFVDGKGEARLNYLRGSNVDEGGSTGLRVRSVESRKLGMVVGSGTLYLPPRGLMGYSELQQPGYAEFVKTPTRKNGMVFLAANDGFVHGFKVVDNDATVVLTHQFGYLPKRILNEMVRYTDNSNTALRSKPYFNDNTPMIADVKLDTGFATVLVNTFGRGAQGFAALNVTKADTVTESTDDLVIREFTQNDDSDMGYIVAQPAVDDTNYSTQIVQVKRSGVNRPAVIIGNGIESRNARAALFVVYLDATGGYDKLVLPGVNNGLATPRVIDVDANGTADLVYVGDLLGNLWAINIKDTKTLSEVTLDNFDASKSIVNKLFSANAPIVSAPLAKRFEPTDVSCTKCYMVNFATGKPSVSPLIYDFNPGQHTVYGVLDKNNLSTVNVSTLVEQKILATIDNKVVVSTTPVNYGAGENGNKNGWFFKLRPGEMVVANPKYRPGGSMLFFSLAPPSSNGTTCTARGGYTYNLVATSGTATKRSFDTNNDGVINSADLVDFGGKKNYPGGEASEGMMGNVQITKSSGSTTESTVSPSGKRELIGSLLNAPRRINWQELDNR